MCDIKCVKDGGDNDSDIDKLFISKALVVILPISDYTDCKDMPQTD